MLITYVKYHLVSSHGAFHVYCPDTVQHILLDCIDLCDTRIKYYRDINTMEKLFNENVYNVINYLKECGLFKKF